MHHLRTADYIRLVSYHLVHGVHHLMSKVIYTYCTLTNSKLDTSPATSAELIYEGGGGSISNQPTLFPMEIHLFFFDVIAL